MKINDTPFLKQPPPYLPITSFLWEKSEAPFFGKFQELMILIHNIDN